MWRIEGLQASLSTPELSARVNLRQPERGLADIEWMHGRLAGARLLQVPLASAGVEPQLVESYFRRADLVTSYEAAPGRSLATQIHWRYMEHADLGAAGFELIVSVRTELPNVDFCLGIGSELRCREVFQAATPDAIGFTSCGIPSAIRQPSLRLAGVGLLVWHLADEAVSYVEMVHPADCSRMEFAAGGWTAECVRSRFQLFEERLEKGVIRRARARVLLCRREGDEAVARESYLRFLDSESPLTG
jgi:hypothetical protein